MTASADRRLPAAVVAAATAEARRAATTYDDAIRWWDSNAAEFVDPLAVEVWAFDPALGHVALVRHRWRGWVPPGGAVEPGEMPRDAAMRELREETGLAVRSLPFVAAVAVRKYHEDWTPTLGLSYAVVLDSRLELRGEDGQEAGWMPLDEPWESVFPDDRPRIRLFAAAIGRSSADCDRSYG
ncbi:MAG TPA: NUDIX hydrolase [Acidimicrobiales bacterium]|nr:NUDIX hydrolase [Acidimicrobiales bacterium]